MPDLTSLFSLAHDPTTPLYLILAVQVFNLVAKNERVKPLLDTVLAKLDEVAAIRKMDKDSTLDLDEAAAIAKLAAFQRAKDTEVE